jgi:NAD-dependent SIR2 family protein deacetylase
MFETSFIKRFSTQVEVPLSAKTHVKESDLSLILGTSLSVQPFAKLAQTPPKLAIINMERTRSFEAEERAKVNVFT